jgi:hypothetical protein
VIKNSEAMSKHWSRYQDSFDYAKDIGFIEACNAVLELMKEILT